MQDLHKSVGELLYSYFSKVLIRKINANLQKTKTTKNKKKTTQINKRISNYANNYNRRYDKGMFSIAFKQTIISFFKRTEMGVWFGVVECYHSCEIVINFSSTLTFPSSSLVLSCNPFACVSASVHHACPSHTLILFISAFPSIPTASLPLTVKKSNQQRDCHE